MNNYTKKQIIYNSIYYTNDKGIYHRTDGPAIEYNNGAKHWYINGKFHRLDGPAKEYSDGSKYWYINGLCHRSKGPAIESSGDKYWYKNGKKHRFNAPAVIIAKINLTYFEYGNYIKCKILKRE